MPKRKGPRADILAREMQDAIRVSAGSVPSMRMSVTHIARAQRRSLYQAKVMCGDAEANTLADWLLDDMRRAFMEAWRSEQTDVPSA